MFCGRACRANLEYTRRMVYLTLLKVKLYFAAKEYAKECVH
jgi:hypothetical protein